MSTSLPSTAAREQIQILAEELRASSRRLLSVLEDVPEELSKVREGDGAWSIMDCVEHICLAEELMSVSLRKRRATGVAPDLKRDAVIRTVALDRSRKINAPEQAKPTGKYPSLAQAKDAFCRARERNIAFIEALDEDLQGSTCLHPMGMFDSYQFVQIMALHPERHASQIEQIKNSAAYRVAIGS